MILHPYLTPDLVALIQTAKPEDIDARLRYVYSEADKDTERQRLGFRVESIKSGGRRMGLNLSVSFDGFAFSGGYNTLRRRVNLKAKGDWRRLFIDRFNEVLNDCELRLARNNVKANADKERNVKVQEREAAVLPLLESTSPLLSWNCRNNGTHVVEDMTIETDSFTPKQIQQVANLVRSFTP